MEENLSGLEDTLPMHKNINSIYGLDLGGSTIDMVVFSLENSEILDLQSLESREFPQKKIPEILEAFGVIEEIKIQKFLRITGGHSQKFPEFFILDGVEIQLIKVPEFESIARGGMFLSGKNSGLVISLGTGTAMVSVKNIDKNDWEHVRGTGIGGGTFLGLGKALLGTSEFSELQDLSESGKLQNIDISVQDIVGNFSQDEKMGMLTPDMTASNFGKFSPEISGKSDIALGIANLVAQSISALAIEKAKVYGHDALILGGKFSRCLAVVEGITKTADAFGMNIVVPENSGFMTVLGGVQK